MEEQNNIVENKNKNNNKIVWIILLVIVMIGCLIGGYFLNDSEMFHKLKSNSDEEKIKEEKSEKNNIKNQNEQKEIGIEDEKNDDSNIKKTNNIDVTKLDISLEKFSNVVFTRNGKNVVKRDEIVGEQLIGNLVALSGKNIESITGKELKYLASKYFEVNNLEFANLTCPNEITPNHTTNVFMIYNEETDKYEYNPNHSGHGGSSDGIMTILIDGKESTDGGYYTYSYKLYYIYTGCIWDTCGWNGIYDVYLSYEDAVNKNNKVLAAADDENYCVNEKCDDDKIYEAIKDKTKTVKFYYKKNNDNYVFDHYEVK